jgi:hypothetical protein
MGFPLASSTRQLCALEVGVRPPRISEILLGRRADFRGYSFPAQVHGAIFGERIQSDKSFQSFGCHANPSDPLSGVFFGNCVRRFREDFDALF